MRPKLRQQRLPAKGQPMATVRAVFRAYDRRHRRHPAQHRHALRHILQTLASGGHAKKNDELFRRGRRAGIVELLRGQTVANQHQSMRYRPRLRGQRLDRLESDPRRMCERRRKGESIVAFVRWKTVRETRLLMEECVSDPSRGSGPETTDPPIARGPGFAVSPSRRDAHHQRKLTSLRRQVSSRNIILFNCATIDFGLTRALK